MKKVNYLFIFFLTFMVYSCVSNSNAIYFETWYSQKDTISSNFEIKDIDTTVFLDYNYLILKNIEEPSNYFVIIEKKLFSMKTFKEKLIKLKLSKLPCNYPLRLKPRSKIDIVISPGGKTILWFQNRVVVDAFEIAH